MPIVGTAGHVDHGKSALVSALTGTNPDRWLEERLRGMTLDLGFARLEIGGIEAGIIDVPGHERFLHNMLAGAAGMDVLLLVVAADEGAMPQTREHLEILRYLNVRRIVVAVSKIDLIPAGERDAAVARIRQALTETIAAGAPAIAVSSVSGEGLTELRAALAEALRAIAPPSAGAPAYLPIDRVFVLPGHGTIATGTLMQGSIAEGDVLGLEPSGFRARVRSIEVFAQRRARVGAGTRVALNLAGVDRATIARGETAVSREFAPRSRFAVRFSAAPDAVSLLRRRTPVRAYVGSAEVLGMLIFERPPDDAGELAAELRLRRPVAAFPGVRFVVRRPSPKTLLGGGAIESVKSDAEREQASPIEAAVGSAIAARGLEAVELGDIAFAANVREEAARAALARLAERDDVLVVRRPGAYVDGAAARELLARIRGRLEHVHREEPWAMGETSLALSRDLGVAEPLLVRLLAEFADRGAIAARAGYYSTLDHRPAMTGEQRAFFESILPAGDARSFLPVRFADVSAAVRRGAPAGTPKAFDALLAARALIKVGDDLYLGAQISAIRARIDAHFRNHGTMTAAQFRDAIGTSRKYAVPLLEWLDATGVTIRDGDLRTPRAASSRASDAAGGDPSRAW